MATKGFVRAVKGMAAAAALAVASSGALANDVTNNISLSGGTTFFGVLHTDNASFTDIFNFDVSGLVLGNASLVTIGAGTQNIDFISADLNGHPLTLTPNGFVETGSLVDTSLVGPLVLTVKGKSGAAGGQFASYSGTLNVTAVPEAETYVLMMVGLVGLGLHSLRRKSNA